MRARMIPPRCHHDRVSNLSLPATSAKTTLTRANGSSANSRSDRKIVITWNRHNAVAITANPDRQVPSGEREDGQRVDDEESGV